MLRKKFADLLTQIDPNHALDTNVEEVGGIILHVRHTYIKSVGFQLLSDIANDFVERVVTASCQLAKHRGSDTLEVKDIQLHLERSWDLRIPGFGLEEPKSIPAPKTLEAHTKRQAAVNKAEQQAPKRKKTTD